MTNIAFYHCQPPNLGNEMHLPVAAIYLKTYIDLERPDLAEHLHWTLPFTLPEDDNVIVNFCHEHSIDILCVSVFIWNEDLLNQQMPRIRSKLPGHVKVVAGGGSIGVHRDPDYLRRQSWMDYAVYGSGEVAFADLLQSLVFNRKLVKFNVSNLAWHDTLNNKVIVSDYRFVPEPKISPYLHNRDLLAAMVERDQARGMHITMSWQLTRGCPYKCTFCDWNLGLGNKVSRRKQTFQQEIDLFQELGVTTINIADANFGQYDEDIEIFQYFLDKNLKEQAGFQVLVTFSKLRKEHVRRLMHLSGQGKFYSSYIGFVFSIQDLDAQVLQNIDRPDVSWEVHREMIAELQAAYPEVPCTINVILGLPGQTLESWKHTLLETMDAGGLTLAFINELLALSPAAIDPDYQTKFDMQYSEALRFNTTYFYRNKFPKSCYSFSQHDMATMTVLTSIWQSACRLRHEAKITVNSHELMQRILTSDNFLRLRDDLYDNWTQNDCFFYRIDFDGNSAPQGRLSACHLSYFDLAWSVHPVLVRMVMDCTVDIKRNFAGIARYLRDNGTSLSEHRPKLTNPIPQPRLPAPRAATAA